MIRLITAVLFVALAQTLAAPASAQSSLQAEDRIQLRLTNSLPDKVDYYLSIEGGPPKPIGSIPPKTTIDIDALSGQVWLFGVNQKPFQKYTTRFERFQNLTLAPKGQQREPVVANDYKPPIGKGAAKTATAESKPATNKDQTAAQKEKVATADKPAETKTKPAAPTTKPAPEASAAVDPRLKWYNTRFKADGGRVNAQIIFGIPETDAVQFVATCNSEGVPDAVLSADVSRLRNGGKVNVRFAGKDFNRTLQGIVVRSDGEGQDGVRLTIPADDMLWEAVARQASLQYAVRTGAGDLPAITLPLRGTKAVVAAYLRDCALLASAAQPKPKPKPEPAATADSCQSKRGIRSTNGGPAVNVTFVNRTKEYRSLEWLDYDGRPVNYAGLNPGESFSVSTWTTHPWMATDGPGNCMEILLATRDGATIEITRPSPGFGPEND